MSTAVATQWLQESHDPSIIAQSGHDGNALTICHRDPDLELTQAVNRLPDAALPNDRCRGSLTDFSAWLAEHAASLESIAGLELTGNTYRDDLAMITADMIAIAQLFDQRVNAAAYVFRCHRLEHTMCPRFHTDQGPMRMFCTYRGPGTEWVPELAVNRRALRTFGTDNDDIVADAEQIRSVPNYALAVLCGCDEHGRGGVVHRSPMVDHKVTAQGDHLGSKSRFAFCMTVVK